jgi:hypothetical protein
MLVTLGNCGRKSERKRHLGNDFVFRTTAFAARYEVDLLGDDLAAIALLTLAIAPASACFKSKKGMAFGRTGQRT